METQKVREILYEIRERKDKMEILKVLERIFIAALLLFLILVTIQHVKHNTEKTVFYMVLFVISVMAALFFARQGVLQREEIQRLLGQSFIKDILAEEVQVIEYASVFKIGDNLRNMCSILPGFTFSKANDYIKGKYKGVEFTYFDLYLKDGVEHAQYDAFKGQVLRLSLKKAINGRIIFKKKDNPRRGVKKLDTAKNAISALSPGVKIETEIRVGNEHLDNFFSITTNNEEMASKLLTSERLERISETIYQASGHTNVEINGKDVFITCDNDFDAFAYDGCIYDENSLERACIRYRDDLKRILAIIDKMIVDEELF